MTLRISGYDGRVYNDSVPRFVSLNSVYVFDRCQLQLLKASSVPSSEVGDDDEYEARTRMDGSFLIETAPALVPLGPENFAHVYAWFVYEPEQPPSEAVIFCAGGPETVAHSISVIVAYNVGGPQTAIISVEVGETPETLAEKIWTKVDALGNSKAGLNGATVLVEGRNAVYDNQYLEVLIPDSASGLSGTIERDNAFRKITLTGAVGVSGTWVHSGPFNTYGNGAYMETRPSPVYVAPGESVEDAAARLCDSINGCIDRNRLTSGLNASVSGATVTVTPATSHNQNSGFSTTDTLVVDCRDYPV